MKYQNIYLSELVRTSIIIYIKGSIVGIFFNFKTVITAKTTKTFKSNLWYHQDVSNYIGFLVIADN